MILAAFDFMSMSFERMAIIVVIIAAVVAAVFVALKQYGLQIPAWVAQLFWIVVVTIAAIFVIKLLISLA